MLGVLWSTTHVCCYVGCAAITWRMCVSVLGMLLEHGIRVAVVSMLPEHGTCVLPCFKASSSTLSKKARREDRMMWGHAQWKKAVEQSEKSPQLVAQHTPAGHTTCYVRGSHPEAGRKRRRGRAGNWKDRKKRRGYFTANNDWGTLFLARHEEAALLLVSWSDSNVLRQQLQI